MRSSTLLLCFLSTIASVTAELKWVTNPSTKKSYLLANKWATYEESELYCDLMQGSLVVLENAAETKWVSTFTKHLNTWEKQPFLGIRAPKQTCQFTWINGKPLDKSVFKFTKGGYTGCGWNEFCAVINKNNFDPKTRFLADCVCNKRHPTVLCQRPRAVPAKPPKWVRNTATKKSYLLANKWANYEESAEYCRLYDASLAVLESKAETLYIKKLTNHLSTWKHQPFLGIEAPGKTCNFKWINGKPVDKSVHLFTKGGYTGCGWNEFCAVINKNEVDPNTRYLADCKCIDRHPTVLCQKPSAVPLDAPKWVKGPANKWYFLVYKWANYEESKAFCEVRKATLVVLESAQETKWLADYTKHLFEWNNQPFLGIQAPGRTCNFKWINNKPLDKSVADFTTKGHVGCGVNEFCGVINTNKFEPNMKYLGDCKCEERHPTILCQLIAEDDRNGGTDPKDQDKLVPGKNQIHNMDVLLENKCKSVPHRSYYHQESSICFTESEQCYNVKYPGNPIIMKSESLVDLRLGRFGLPEDGHNLCAFIPTRSCISGTKVGEHCFFVTPKQNWKNALAECRKSNAELFVPHNDEDMLSVLRYTAGTIVDPLWLGFNPADKWTTQDGSPVDYVRWKPVIEKSTNTAAVAFQPLRGTLGSYAAYMTMEKVDSSYYGLCAYKLK